MKHTLRFRAYLPDDVASEAWRHIDILRQIRNHAVRDYYRSEIKANQQLGWDLPPTAETEMLVENAFH